MLNYRQLQAGDTITVHYNGSGSDRTTTGTFQGFVGPDNHVVLTTPTGETDTALQNVLLFNNYYYIERAA
jgi:hypothetical protein